MVSADVPPERKPERGYVRQNHPFTKPPFYLPVTLFGVDKRVVSKRVVLVDVPPERKPGTRVHSPKPPFYETALLSPSDPFWFNWTGSVFALLTSRVGVGKCPFFSVCPRPRPCFLLAASLFQEFLFVWGRSEFGVGFYRDATDGGDADGGDLFLCSFCMTVRCRLSSADCHCTDMQHLAQFFGKRFKRSLVRVGARRGFEISLEPSKIKTREQKMRTNFFAQTF